MALPVLGQYGGTIAEVSGSILRRGKSQQCRPCASTKTSTARHAAKKAETSAQFRQLK
jgi:hypothetical protein